MKPTDCTFLRHGEQILAILNEAIVSSTALYDYQPRTTADMAEWFAAKSRGGFPVVGLEGQDGSLAGFATYGTFRNWPAYKYTVEHSLYIHKEQRGRGLGRRLLEELIRRAEAQELHALVGVIDAGNAASIAFHKQMGFTHAGTLREVGYKFGRWLDVAFYQRLLRTPSHPQDG